MKGKEYIPPQKRVNKLVTYVSVAGDWSQDKGEVRKKWVLGVIVWWRKSSEVERVTATAQLLGLCYQAMNYIN